MSYQQKQTRFIRNVLYALKRQYGFPVTFTKILTSSVNPETGRQTAERRTLTVRRAIVLPSLMQRKFAYDLTFIAQNKNFTYGGFYDTSRRRLIIDRRDVPSDFDVEIDDYFIFEDRRWQVAEVEEFEFKTGLIIIGQEAKMAPLGKTFDVSVQSTLNLSQSVDRVE